VNTATARSLPKFSNNRPQKLNYDARTRGYKSSSVVFGNRKKQLRHSNVVFDHLEIATKPWLMLMTNYPLNSDPLAIFLVSQISCVREINVVVGTQLLTKTLHFPCIMLVQKPTFCVESSQSERDSQSDRKNTVYI